MKKNKSILKTVCCLTGLMILLSVVFNIFQYVQFKKLSENYIQGQVTKNEQDNVSNRSKIGNTETSGNERVSIGIINELEYHMNAAQEELDMIDMLLDEELYKKTEYKKRMAQLIESEMSSPYYEKEMRDSYAKLIDAEYSALFKKLNAGGEDAAKLKDLLIEKNLKVYRIMAPDIYSSSTEAKNIAREKAAEIEDEYNNRIRELLGEEDYIKLKYYDLSLRERNNLSNFKRSATSDFKIDEEQTEYLIDSMYAARKEIYDQLASAYENSSPELTEEKVNQLMLINKQVNKEYLEICASVMTPEQIEQYKAYTEHRLDLLERTLKKTMYLEGES